MLNIFNELHTRIKGVMRFPKWEYVKEGMTINLDSANSYYRSGAYAVDSDHELIKLLFGLSISTDTDLTPYYKAVDNKALTVAQQLGYTTSMSRGRVFNDVFFTGGSKEIIIVTDEPFDPVQVTQNWKDARPIRVLRHGFDQLDCFPMTGRMVSHATSVFAINLPMLAVQYRAYRQWQKTYANEQTGRNSIYHFCYAYPINNMIYEATDIAIFNRLIRLSQGLATSDNQFKHPFHVMNFTLKCDDVLKRVLETIKNQHLDLGNIAMTVPMVTTNSLFELMRLPDVLETRQINWALVIARFPMLMFLFDFDEAVKQQNQTEVSKLKYALKLYLTDGTIRSAVPKDMYDKQVPAIKRLIETL